MTANEHIEDFREVTEAEKTALELSDAAWSRPPQSFIDEWAVAVGTAGCYNEETGYFELNGLTDITYSEAMLIARKSASVPRNPSNSLGSAYTHTDVRTVPVFGGWGNRYGAYSIANAFKDCLKLEVVIADGGNMTGMGDAFYGCSRLRKVVLNTSYYISGANRTFEECPALEEVSFSANIHTSVSFADSPLLSLASIDNIVKHLQSDNGRVLTLHPQAYARVTDEIFTLAASKDITIATT